MVMDESDAEEKKCGENLTWELNGGTLIISGSGSMYDYSQNNQPWSGNPITAITIGNDVTSIGAYAFYGTAIRELTIPRNISWIGSNAFSNCSSLSVINFNASSCGGEGASIGKMLSNSNVRINIGNSVNIPDYFLTESTKVTHISLNGPSSVGIEAFKGCTNAVFSGSTSSIAFYSQHAFQNCIKLTTIAIGPNVSGFNSSVFDGCSGVTAILVKNSSLKVTSTPFQNLGVNTGINIEVSSTNVPANLFKSFSKNGTVTLTDNVKTIGNDAFYSGNLSINLENAKIITTVGSYAFSGTNINTIIIPETVKTIGEGAFSYCKNVQSIIFNAKQCNDLTASNNVFGNLTGTPTVIIGDSVTLIPSHLFINLKGSGIVSLPASITSIHEFAFKGSTLDVDLSKCNELSDIGAYALYDSSTSKIDIPPSVKTLGKCCFAECDHINTINWNTETIEILPVDDRIFENSGSSISFKFGNNIKSIPHYILHNNNKIGSISFSKQIISIGDYAFFNCSGTVSLNGCDRIEYLGSHSFDGSHLTAVYLPNTITACGASVFDNLSYVTQIYYGSTVVDNAIQSGLVNVNGIRSPSDVSLTFGPAITKIQDNLFNGTKAISDINFKGIETIGNSAFVDASVTDLEFPSSLKSIGFAAFKGTKMLNNIIFNNFYTTIGEHAFWVDTKKDLSITLFRTAVQNDYDWRGDQRNPDFTWVHIKGEYSGMLEVFFSFMEPVLGYEFSNEIIDFLVDHNALKALEAIDLGNLENNYALLTAISILLTVLLFLFLYWDKSELVREIETILSFFVIDLAICYSCIRRSWEYLDDSTMSIILTIVFLLGIVRPLLTVFTQLKDKPKPRPGEHLVRMYCLDIDAFKHAIFQPWTIKIGGPIINLISLVISVPFSAIFTVAMFLCHIPALLLSIILSKTFRSIDEKDTQPVLCPECNHMITPVYICPKCGVGHESLKSGVYGFKKAQCECGEILKCTAREGRWNLYQAKCPDPDKGGCGNPLLIKECRPVPITIVGSPDSGKTSLAASMIKTLSEMPPSSNYFASIVYNETTTIVKAFESDNIPGTGKDEVKPHIVLMEPQKIAKNDTVPTGYYIYDPPGNLYVSNKTTISDLEYYKHLKGLIILINPRDIDEYAYNNHIKNSIEHFPAPIFNTFMVNYESIGAVDKNKEIDIPIAVVINHAKEVGLNPILCNSISDDPLSSPVRQFLINNRESTIVNSIELKFDKFRYFAIDSKYEEDYGVSILILKWISQFDNKTL